MKQYHILKDGKKEGPYELAWLQLHPSSFGINKDTLILKPGSENWSPAGELTEFQHALGLLSSSNKSEGSKRHSEDSSSASMNSEIVIISCTLCGTKNRAPKNKPGALCAKCKNPLINHVFADATFSNKPRYKPRRRRRTDIAAKARSTIFILFFGYLFGPALLREVGLCFSDESWQCPVANEPTLLSSTQNKTIYSESDKADIKQAFLNQSLWNRQQIQSGLKSLGYYTSRLDGVWGAGTERALSDYGEQKNIRPIAKHLFSGLRYEVKDKNALFKQLYTVQPVNAGEIWYRGNGERLAPLRITVPAGNNYVIWLKDIFDDTDILSAFVKSGGFLDIKVPLGTYKLRYAGGTDWFGEKRLFGPGTRIYSADKEFIFDRDGNRINGTSITLQKVEHGNLPTSLLETIQL